MTHRGISRRVLLGASALSTFSAAAFLLHSRSGRAEDAVAAPSKPPVLVTVFLRGAADALNVIVPHADPEYYKLRPAIAVPVPGGARGAIDLDGRYGLHPRLAPLKAAFDAKELAVLVGTGSPHRTRSHFEAQDYMETGDVGNPTASRGWLGRYLATRPATGPEVIRAVAVSDRSPLALRGYPDAVVASNLRDYKLNTTKQLEPVLAHGFARLYQADATTLAEHAGQRALASSEIVRRALGNKRRGHAGYAKDAQDFGDVARLIKADVGLETAWLDLGGWDTHHYEGSADNGDLPRRLDQLGRALAAFRADLGPDFERVTVLVMSEFGRTVRENGTGGTDHGHGSFMLALGGRVQGGRVFGHWPTLTPDQLYEGRDLPVTADFRDVLGEVCEQHLGLANAGPLFPSYKLDPARRLGLFAQSVPVNTSAQPK